MDETLSRFAGFGDPTQGSSFLATLGWRTQSPWDWRMPSTGFMKLAVTTLVFCVAALLALGMVMLYSASAAQAGARYLAMQGIWCLLGLGRVWRRRRRITEY